MATLKRESSSSWWYSDGIDRWRCKVCLRLKAEAHHPECPFGLIVSRLTVWRDDDGFQDHVKELCDLMDICEVPDITDEQLAAVCRGKGNAMGVGSDPPAQETNK